MDVDNPYVGPAMQTVPIGWFQEAAELAARAPSGMTISITMTEYGFTVHGVAGDREGTDRVSFFDLAMEDKDNPFVRQIARISEALRA